MTHLDGEYTAAPPVLMPHVRSPSEDHPRRVAHLRRNLPTLTLMSQNTGRECGGLWTGKGRSRRKMRGPDGGSEQG